HRRRLAIAADAGERCHITGPGNGITREASTEGEHSRVRKVGPSIKWVRDDHIACAQRASSFISQKRAGKTGALIQRDKARLCRVGVIEGADCAVGRRKESRIDGAFEEGLSSDRREVRPRSFSSTGDRERGIDARTIVSL